MKFKFLMVHIIQNRSYEALERFLDIFSSKLISYVKVPKGLTLETAIP